VHFTLPQCLYKGALYLTSVPVQGCTLPYLSACKTVTFTLLFYFFAKGHKNATQHSITKVHAAKFSVISIQPRVLSPQLGHPNISLPFNVFVHVYEETPLLCQQFSSSYKYLHFSHCRINLNSSQPDKVI